VKTSVLTTVAEAAAHSTSSPAYLLSQQTTVSSAKLPNYLYLVKFWRYYSAECEYIIWLTLQSK